MSGRRPTSPPGRAERSAVPPSRRASGAHAGGAPPAAERSDEWTLFGLADEADIDPAELREFLAADLLDVQADPVFKERLRQKLWRIVRMRYGDGED